MKKLLILFILISANCIAQKADNNKNRENLFSKNTEIRNVDSAKKENTATNTSPINPLFLKNKIVVPPTDSLNVKSKNKEIKSLMDKNLH